MLRKEWQYFYLKSFIVHWLVQRTEIWKEVSHVQFTGGPVVRTQCFYFGGPGSIPGLGTKICKLHDVAKKKNEYACVFANLARAHQVVSRTW